VGRGSSSVAARRYYGGAVRDASDGIFKIFKDATTKPSTTVNFAEAGLAYADLTVGGLTAAGAVSLSGTVDIQEMRETVVPVTITSNIATCDWTAGNIYYIGTAPSANYGVAITNVPTDNNKVMTINLIVSTAATSYSPIGTFSVNGTTVVPKYASGSAPAGTAVASRLDVFTYTLLRVGSAWTVLGSANVNYY
jgi:hypothetical protein